MDPATPGVPGAPPPPPPAAPAAPPPVMPVYAPPPGPAAPAAPEYKQGGLLGQFDWVEIGFMIAGLFGIFTVVRYYNNREKVLKQGQQTVDQLGGQVAKLQHSFDGMRRGQR